MRCLAASSVLSSLGPSLQPTSTIGRVVPAELGFWRAFLARPAKGPDAERWVKYAEAELEKMPGDAKASDTG